MLVNAVAAVMMSSLPVSEVESKLVLLVMKTEEGRSNQAETWLAPRSDLTIDVDGYAREAFLVGPVGPVVIPTMKIQGSQHHSIYGQGSKTWLARARVMPSHRVRLSGNEYREASYQ